MVCGGFTNEEIHFAVWKIPFRWASVMELMLLEGSKLGAKLTYHFHETSCLMDSYFEND